VLYTAYADPRAGLFLRRFGRENFRLLIVTTPDYKGRSRRRNILETIRKAVGPSDLFLAITLDQLNAERILQPVWRQPGGERGVSIIATPAGNVSVRTRRKST
jgi:hypothetical protein